LESLNSYTVYRERESPIRMCTRYIQREAEKLSQSHTYTKGGYKLNLPKGYGSSNNDNRTDTHHRGMGRVQLDTR
jgi:hypothetical protein